MSEQAASIAGEVKTPVSNSVVTESEFLATVISRMEDKAKGSQAEPAPEPEEAPEAESETPEQSSGDQPAVEAESQTEGEEAKTKQEESAVLSKIDFEQLSEAEIMELAQKARSKALSRFGELTADKKALQAQIAQLQAELAKANPKPLEVAPQIPKEFASIEKVEDIQAKVAEMKATIDWAENHLDNAEHLASDDQIQTEHGSITKAELRRIYKMARKAKDEWLPAQYAELTNRQNRAALREALVQKAKQELKWMDGEDNDVRKQYEALAKNPSIEKIKKAVPEAEVDLEYILAHAVNSIYGKTYYNVATGEQQKPSIKLTPPAPVKTAAAPRASESFVKQVKEAESKFETTRSEQDLEALLAARLRAKRG